MADFALMQPYSPCICSPTRRAYAALHLDRTQPVGYQSGRKTKLLYVVDGRKPTVSDSLTPETEPTARLGGLRGRTHHSKLEGRAVDGRGHSYDTCNGWIVSLAGELVAEDEPGEKMAMGGGPAKALCLCLSPFQVIDELAFSRIQPALRWHCLPSSTWRSSTLNFSSRCTRRYQSEEEALLWVVDSRDGAASHWM